MPRRFLKAALNLIFLSLGNPFHQRRIDTPATIANILESGLMKACLKSKRNLNSEKLENED